MIDDNKLIKTIFAEAVEMTIRLETYLYSSFSNLEGRSAKILENYYLNGTIKVLKEKLEKNWRYYKIKTNSNNSLSSNATNRLFKGIYNVFSNLKWANMRIDFLKNISIRPEIYLLQNDIIKCFKGNFLNFNISLKNEYNYEECLEDLNQTISGENIENSTIILLFIPQIEINNPLMWTHLAHEITHAYEELNNILKEIRREFGKEIEGIHQERLFEYWGREILADVVGLRLFDLGYYISFILFSIRAGDMITKCENHPPHLERIEIMKDLLYKEFRDIREFPNIKNIIDDYRDIAKRYADLEKTNVNIHQHYIRNEVNPEERRNIENAMEKLIENGILKKISEIGNIKLGNFIKCIFIKDFNKLNKLKTELKNGFIISSSRKDLNSSIFDKIDNIRTNQEVYDLFNYIREEPNSVFEIINAGWLYRTENHLGNFENYFINNESFEKGYNDYKNHILKYDDILLKSIENSELHRFFIELGDLGG